MRAWQAGRILRDSLGGYAAAAQRRGAGQPGHAALDSWLSPSELAEYVYCPEAHRLRDERPTDSPRQQAGRQGHEELLGRYKRSRSMAPVRVLLWLAAAAGLALLISVLTGRLG